MRNALENARYPGESRKDYLARRKLTQAAVKRLLHGHPAEGYVNGPHRSHQPKEIKQQVVTRTGEIQTLKVDHPGTLIKSQPKRKD